MPLLPPPPPPPPPTPTRRLRELVEQVLQAARLLVQLVQGPALGLGEGEDLRPEIPTAVRGERHRGPAVAGAPGRMDRAHAGEVAQRVCHSVARRLNGDLDGALGLPDQ